ncbi:uncharacterized protein [Ptychodera flava]
MTRSSIQLKVLEAQHRVDAVELLTDVFPRKEPTLNFLQAPYESVKHFNEIAVNRAIRDGIATVAFDNEANKLAGVFACFLISQEHEGSEYFADVKLLAPVKPVVDLFAVLRARFYQLEEVKAEQSRGSKFVEMYLIGVQDGYHGQGMARRLIEYSLKLGKAKGAKMAYAEVTSPITQHIAASDSRFIRVGDMIEYATFEVNGEKPYACMPSEWRGAVLSVTNL